MEREKGRQKKRSERREIRDGSEVNLKETAGRNSPKCFGEVSGSLVPCTAVYCVVQLD
jgi:hypothetical protein